jgi:hypothetical protein
MVENPPVHPFFNPFIGGLFHWIEQSRRRGGMRFYRRTPFKNKIRDGDFIIIS